MKAVWNNAVIAESDDIATVEGNAYFPMASVNPAHLRESATPYTCPWKGQAQYFDVVVDGAVNKDAAWRYPDPKPAAAAVRDRIAFWKGVTVTA
jgi:uncharacterized protein (DUF427 family)